MECESSLALLVRKSVFALIACFALVLFCYLFVDRPVAFFVHDHKLSHHVFLKWLTLPPPILQAWAPVALVAVVLLRLRAPQRRWERTVFAAGIAIIIADQFRESLSAVFGRDWPDTWSDNNPSLIRDGAYGFHLFHGSAAQGSFPSGHTARTVAIAAVVWIAYPRWRWACVAMSAAVAGGLLGMNYHFASDVIAGGFIGGIVGAFAAYFSGLKP